MDQKITSGNLKNERLISIKEKKKYLDLEEEKKALEKLSNLHNTIEKSRVIDS